MVQSRGQIEITQQIVDQGGAYNRSLQENQAWAYDLDLKEQYIPCGIVTAIAMYRVMDMTFWLPQAEAVLAQGKGGNGMLLLLAWVQHYNAICAG